MKLLISHKSVQLVYVGVHRLNSLFSAAKGPQLPLPAPAAVSWGSRERRQVPIGVSPLKPFLCKWFTVNFYWTTTTTPQSNSAPDNDQRTFRRIRPKGGGGGGGSTSVDIGLLHTGPRRRRRRASKVELYRTTLKCQISLDLIVCARAYEM